MKALLFRGSTAIDSSVAHGDVQGVAAAKMVIDGGHIGAGGDIYRLAGGPYQQTVLKAWREVDDEPSGYDLPKQGETGRLMPMTRSCPQICRTSRSSIFLGRRCAGSQAEGYRGETQVATGKLTQTIPSGSPPER